eukprot:CAMPEP_0170192688 /NCGR_PEP_ID=MMETSP0040_2-20121228/54943_1 /TAXON_ID=641309 /ORGANISM="Lotharella oceanica, Strain CCMP622" /LENGTH=168 /DNA_ID=CAMNT_0010441125 /DNA_START=87 /DNA_END=593 /DNA_ORIENTATION=-
MMCCTTRVGFVLDPTVSIEAKKVLTTNNGNIEDTYRIFIANNKVFWEQTWVKKSPSVYGTNWRWEGTATCNKKKGLYKLNLRALTQEAGSLLEDSQQEGEDEVFTEFKNSVTVYARITEGKVVLDTSQMKLHIHDETSSRKSLSQFFGMWDIPSNALELDIVAEEEDI